MHRQDGLRRSRDSKTVAKKDPSPSPECAQGDPRPMGVEQGETPIISGPEPSVLRYGTGVVRLGGERESIGVIITEINRYWV